MSSGSAFDDMPPLDEPPDYRRPSAAREGPASATLSNDIVTEDSAALEFAAIYRDRLRYCHDRGAWFEWTGAAWRMNRDGLAFHWARELARRMAAGENAKARYITSKTSFASGVERFARHDRGLTATAEVWNQDPWLLGTPNGTVDLRSGELKASRQADHITKLTAVAPAQAPDCPAWLRFLDEATKADPQMIRHGRPACSRQTLDRKRLRGRSRA